MNGIIQVKNHRTCNLNGKQKTTTTSDSLVKKLKNEKVTKTKLSTKCLNLYKTLFMEDTLTSKYDNIILLGDFNT